MTAILKVDTIQDTAGNNIINESSDTITIGASGDTITVPSGATINLSNATQTGVGGANTPFFLANKTAAQTLSSGTSTKVTGLADVYDTSSTFADNKFTPAVAGYYYLEGTTNVNIASAGKYLQSMIYKNGSLISWSQVVAEGTNNTYASTTSVIDLADTDDYYELYIRQNTGGDVTINYDSSAKYTRFLGYKLIT